MRMELWVSKLLNVGHKDEIAQAFVVGRNAISMVKILVGQEALSLRPRHAP